MTPKPSSTSRALALGLLTSALGASALVGCGRDATVRSAGRLSIDVAPLTLAGIDDATWTITVTTSAPPPGNVVWTASGLASSRFGDGAGSLAYVGPCDASANPNHVALVLNEVRAGGRALRDDELANPAPPGRPIVVDAICRANADTLVRIDVAIMRDASQGFFDVAVNFDDIFCSAKVDCVGSLLHDGDGDRGPTVVLALACTAGQTTSGAAEPTWLHLSDLALECEGEPPLYFDPSVGPGRAGALGPGPSFFDTATYRGQERLPGYDKCYWNSALGVNLGAHARDCHLRGQATASHASFGPTGRSPASTVYPYVSFDVTLTSPDGGALACAPNPLDGLGSGVRTHYTPPEGAAFTHEWECSESAPIATTALACDGTLAGGAEARVMPGPAGASVVVGGVRSPTYQLPPGVFLGAGATCCANPCCAAP